MIPEPTNTDELITTIRKWFRLLAMDQWTEASTMLDEPNCYGICWTSEHIRQALDSAYESGCDFRAAYGEELRITDPDTTAGHPHADVVEFDDGSGYGVDHDVPLNGIWSELTAQFEFLRRQGGLAVVLHDLHVR